LPVMALSRTFIDAEIRDNPYLHYGGYRNKLAGMPEELREAYMKGNFAAGIKEDAFQVIKSAWVDEAVARWTPDGYKHFAMTAMGLDPAGGGRDDQILCWRHGGWYAKFHKMTGNITADPRQTAAAVMTHRTDSAPVIVDIGGGYGSAVAEKFRENGFAYATFNGSNRSMAKTKDGSLGFHNKRAEAWWKMREALDPSQIGGSSICLPPDPELRADLCSPRYEVSDRGILIEDKDSIRERLGRSPGRGDAAVMALSEGNAARRNLLSRVSLPKAILGHQRAHRRYN
jgi:hypothetical protein